MDPTVRILLEEIAIERTRKRRLESLLDDILAEKEDLLITLGIASPTHALPAIPSSTTTTIATTAGSATKATATAGAGPGGSITAEYEYKIVTKRQRLSFSPNNGPRSNAGRGRRRKIDAFALPPPPGAPLAIEQQTSQPIVTFPPEQASAAQPLAAARAPQTLQQPLTTSHGSSVASSPTPSATISASPSFSAFSSYSPPEIETPAVALARMRGNELRPAADSPHQTQQQSSPTTEVSSPESSQPIVINDGALVSKQHFPSITLPLPRNSFSAYPGGIGSLGSVGSLGSFGSFSQLFDVQRRNSSCGDAALVAAAEAVANGSMSGRKPSIGRGITVNGRFSMDWSQWTDDHALCDTLTDFFDF